MSAEVDHETLSTDGDKVRTVLKKRQFVDEVAAASGQKKPVAKSVVDATLSALGEALSRGDTLVLPPLGRLTVSRSKDAAGAEILVLKLRRVKEGTAGAEADGASPDDSED